MLSRNLGQEILLGKFMEDRAVSPTVADRNRRFAIEVVHRRIFRKLSRESSYLIADVAKVY